MDKAQATQEKLSSATCNPVLTLGGRVSRGTTFIALALAAGGTGLVFGWDSLAALGLSTIVLSLLPCLAMCILGVCASRMSKK